MQSQRRPGCRGSVGRCARLHPAFEGLDDAHAPSAAGTGGKAAWQDRVAEVAALNRCRRLSKDWECLNRTALAFLRWASIRLMVRKLCQEAV